MIDRAHLLDGMRILVADDEILIATCIEATLREAGAEIVSASTVSSALEGAEGDALSAAVLDVRMGQQTTERVADRLTILHVPFIFYSGHSLPADMKAKYRDVPVLLKPISLDDLIDAVVHVVTH